jgi:hypothetical protein
MPFERLRQQQQRARKEQTRREETNRNLQAQQDAENQRRQQRRQETQRQDELVDNAFTDNAAHWYGESGVGQLLVEFTSLVSGQISLHIENPPVSYGVRKISKKWFSKKMKEDYVLIKRCVRADLSPQYDREREFSLGFSASGEMIVAGDEEIGVTTLSEQIWRNDLQAVESAIEKAYLNPHVEPPPTYSSPRDNLSNF